MAVLNAHFAMPVLGTPMPRPTTVLGPAALVSITVTVPDAVAPNERDAAPPGVSRLAKIDVVGPLGVVGVVGVVLSLPQAADMARAAINALTRATDWIVVLMSVTDAPRGWCSRPSPSDSRCRRFSRST